MKKYELKDFVELFEKNKKLEHKSKRKYIGFLLDFIRKIFSPILEFLLARKFETQRVANLSLLKELIELKKFAKENLENLQKDFNNFNIHFRELQREVLNLRDEKIPALKDALSLGLEGVDKKAEWALSNLIVIKKAIEKEINLNEEEKRKLKESLSTLHFMNLFRGSEEEIKKKQKIYFDKLKNSKKVVDLGCGRGEFLEILKENSISCFGVEKEPSLCAILKEKNLDFLQMDIFEFLEKKPFEFDAVTSFHLIEHLNLKEALTLLKLIFNNLSQEGIFIIETPNPTSLYSFLNFYKDPEHKTPFHPETLKFFTKELGFEIIEEIYLQDIQLPENINLQDDVKKLIFGPQDYALILKKM